MAYSDFSYLFPQVPWSFMRSIMSVTCTTTPQWEHLTYLPELGISNGAPQLGHLMGRIDKLSCLIILLSHAKSSIVPTLGPKVFSFRSFMINSKQLNTNTIRRSFDQIYQVSPPAVSQLESCSQLVTDQDIMIQTD